MAVYPLIHKPDFSYNDFLMHNQYIGDIKNGIQRASTNVVKGQALSTKILNDTLMKKSDFIASTIDTSFTGLSRDMSTMKDTISSGMERVDNSILELDNSMQMGFGEVTSGISNLSDTMNEGMSHLGSVMTEGFEGLSSDIQSLHSDFNMAMGGVLLQFEMQREEMKQGFDSIISILENKRKTDAAEDFNDAIEFYNDGCKFIDKPIWFKNAHKHFSASIDKYERNPLAHLHLAHIYHYQEEFRDFDKALEHYELCFTYGEADEKSKAVTAQGYFYAGWLEAVISSNYDEAIKLTKRVIEFDPKLVEKAYYNLAKFYSLKRDAKNSIHYLELLIKNYDRTYAIKVKSDADFQIIDNDFNKLLESLKQESYQQVVEFFKLKDTIDSYDLPLDSYGKIVIPSTLEIDKLIEKNTYFDYLDAIPKILRLKDKFMGLRLSERDELHRQIIILLQIAKVNKIKYSYMTNSSYIT